MRALSFSHLIVTLNDATFRQIERRHFHSYLISGRQADELQPHPTRDKCYNPMPIGQFHPNHRVRQNFNYSSFNPDGV